MGSTSAGSEVKSLYKVLAVYVNGAQKFGDYIKGYIDGKDKLDAFLKEYTSSSGMKFIVRTSSKKQKKLSSSKTCSRYGQEGKYMESCFCSVKYFNLYLFSACSHSSMLLYYKVFVAFQLQMFLSTMTYITAE